MREGDISQHHLLDAGLGDHLKTGRVLPAILGVIAFTEGSKSEDCIVVRSTLPKRAKPTHSAL